MTKQINIYIRALIPSESGIRVNNYNNSICALVPSESGIRGNQSGHFKFVAILHTKKSRLRKYLSRD